MSTSVSLTIGHYELTQDEKSILGVGGMGTVYLGVDQTTSQPVAIKRLHTDVINADPTIILRFQREAEILRLLNHPNIVALLDAIKHDDTHYLVMEYVSGGSLRDLLTRHNGGISVQRALGIAIELADALSRAHHKHVIHRDIKPANVLLSADGTPKLTDFGIARVGDHSQVTRDGMIIGTISYLAPEGFGGQVDARSDIWSFGVLLYEMLTDCHPFQETSVAGTINAIMTRSPDLSAFPDSVPPLAKELVRQMLEKDPANRVHSMRLVAAQLEAILAGASDLPDDTPAPVQTAKPVSRTSDSTTDRVTAKPRTSPLAVHLIDQETVTDSDIQIKKATRSSVPNRRLLLIAAISLALGFIAIALLLLIGDSNSTAVEISCDISPDRYMVLVADLEPIETKAANPSRFILNDLKTKFEVEAPYSHLTICAYPGVVTSHAQAEEVAKRYGAISVIWGAYTETYSEVSVDVGYPKAFASVRADRSFIEAIGSSRLRMNNAANETVALPLLGVLVAFQNADGDGYGAARTVTVMQQINATLPEVIGESAGAYGQRYFGNFINNPEYALEAVTKSLEINRNYLQYISRSGLRLRLGDIEGARQDALTALRMGPSGWVMPQYILGNIALANNDYAGALSNFAEIIEVRPDDWFVLSLRGGVHYLLGNYADARSDAEAAIELGTEANFPHMLLLMLCIREGDLVAAQDIMRVVLRDYPDPSFGMRIVSATFGPDFPIIFAPVFSAFGNLTLGQYDELLLNIDQALVFKPDLTDLFMMKGFAHCNLGNYAEAERAYTEAIESEPDFVALYTFRAEVRLKLRNILGAASDVSTVLRSEDGERWSPIIQAAQDGSLNCTNLLDFDISSLVRKEE